MLDGVLPDTPLVHAFIIVVAAIFIWRGSGLLEESADRLSKYYGVPAVIQGSVVVAIGSSFPELASVVITAMAGSFDMGVGAIVGSAIFNILVIPAVAGIATEDTLDSSRALVYKEAQFYMIAVSVLVVTFAFSVIYFPVDGAATLTGEVTRWLAVIPLGLYVLYVFIQWQDMNDHDGGTEREGITAWREWGKLAVGLLIILITVEQMVGAVEGLSHTFGIPEFLAGVTIIAAATSLPDALVSIRTARAGKHVTSLGNVLGSNTFDLLVAIPLGVMIAGAAPVNFTVAVPMMGVLTLATILLFTVMRTGLTLSGTESYALLIGYCLFVSWVVAESIGVTSVIPGA